MELSHEYWPWPNGLTVALTLGLVIYTNNILSKCLKICKILIYKGLEYIFA